MRRTARKAPLALAIATALLVSACGGSGGGSVGAEASQTLTVWAMGDEGQKLAEVADEYEKQHPNVKVDVTPIGWDVAHQKLVSAAAAGTLPDMAQMGSTYMGEFAALGVLEPVDTSVFKKEDFFPAAWENNVSAGKVYGVPWYVDTRVLYYRTDLAQAAGITKAPTTWADLSQLAAAYRDRAGTSWGIHLKPSGLDTWQSWLPFLYSAGGALLDNGKPALDSPATVKALREYGSYFQSGLTNKSLPPGYDAVKDFGSGAVPMFVDGTYQATSINEQQPQLAGKWAVAPLPADVSSTSFAGGSGLVTFADSEHKAAATEFIRYLSSPEVQADWYRRTTDLPASKAAWNQGLLGSSPELQVYRTQMEGAKAVPVLPNWAEFSSKIDAAIEAVTQGKASPEDAAKQLQAETASLVR